MNDDDLGIEPGYLNREKLAPGEIARIEEALASASNESVRRQPSRWPRIAAVAATLAALAFLLARQPSPPAEGTRGTPMAGAPPRAMVLEIQRTDIADSKPYRLVIQMETGTPAVDIEEQP